MINKFMILKVCNKVFVLFFHQVFDIEIVNIHSESLVFPHIEILAVFVTTLNILTL